MNTKSTCWIFKSVKPRRICYAMVYAKPSTGFCGDHPPIAAIDGTGRTESALRKLAKRIRANPGLINRLCFIIDLRGRYPARAKGFKPKPAPLTNWAHGYPVEFATK